LKKENHRSRQFWEKKGEKGRNKRCLFYKVEGLEKMLKPKTMYHFFLRERKGKAVNKEATAGNRRRGGKKTPCGV